jgi:L-ascorbate metabolism protein UlaG (beta-lactamase superfamily)
MIKRILLGLLILILLAAGFVYFRTRPSGDINKYSEYFVNNSAAPTDSSLQVTFFGVSTLLIDDGETQILIDGFFSRPSMITALTSDISSDTAVIEKYIRDYDMRRVKGVFVTHTHYDHSFDAGYVAGMTGATLYGSESTLNVGRGAGVDEDYLQLYTPNAEYLLGEISIRVVPSIHSPGNALDDEGIVVSQPFHQPSSFKAYPEGGSFDFLITHRGKKLYIKPSPNFVEGALDTLDVDALFIGIATITKHGPEWTDKFYKENVTALNPSLVVPIHWDNFFYPISDELVMMPKFTCNAEKDFDYFVERTKADSIQFSILQGTKSVVVFN